MNSQLGKLKNNKIYLNKAEELILKIVESINRSTRWFLGKIKIKQRKQ